MSGRPLIRVDRLTRHYDMGSEVVQALRGVGRAIASNEYVAIMGPSGSGKSTLMNLLGCLDTPSDGEYWLNSQKVSELDDDELARIRNKEIGFVFQTFNLLPRATSLHNVELPLIYAGVGAKDRRERAAHALEKVGLGDRMHHKPNELSGGQRQRICIARAILRDAPILILDEATSALDTESEAMVQKALANLMQNRTTFVIAHRLSTIMHANKIAVLDAGRLCEIGTHDELLVASPLYAALWQAFSADAAAGSAAGSAA